METSTKNTIIILTLIIILTGGLFYSQHRANKNFTQALTNNITTLQEKLHESQQQLENTIINLESYTRSEDDFIKKDFSTRIRTVENKLNITQKEQQQSIKALRGKLEKVENDSTARLTAFEEQIKTIKVKNKDFSGIIQDILQTVVTIRTDKGIGSGVIINKKGYIVTNYHVMDGATQAGLMTFDRHVYPIHVIGAEKTRDIAIIKINADADLPFLEFELVNVNVGEKVIAVGNPAGLDFSVTEGIISNTERTGPNGATYLQTDVPINPGNSGGPLVNIRKKIVGIATMKRENMEGLGFAIPATAVKQISEQIIEQYEREQATN